MSLRTVADPPRSSSRIAIGLLLALALAGGPMTATGQVPPNEAPPTLSASHLAWLDEVALLISDQEREGFMSLQRDYQRDAFIGRFWQVRDPFPETGKNEFREAWNHRLELAGERFESLDHDRARTMLLAGPPRKIVTDLCPVYLRPMEAWSYGPNDAFPGGYYLIFVALRGRSESAYVHWSPIRGLDSLLDWTESPTGIPDFPEIELSRRCGRHRELTEVLDRSIDWHHLQSKGSLVPRPPDEWVKAFLGRTTDVQPGTEAMTASLQLEFPGRHQHRTVVQGLITLPRELADPSQSPDSTYRLRVDGDIVRQGRLFESFRYLFEFPVDQISGDEIPLAIQRHLRPNDYDLILKLEDLNSGRVFYAEQRIHVPAVEVVTAHQIAPAPIGDSPAMTEVSRQLSEANTVLTAGEHVIEILPPPERLLTDRLRVEARTIGDGIAKVTFVLNGRSVMSKTRPPYSLEIDLGHAPRLHTLEAIALDESGTELARDQIPINAGPHRFAVRLLEPQPGKRYVQSLRAFAEVDVPAGEQLDRLDFYLNEIRLASLYQPPFVQPVLLPQNQRITYVRVVAYLVDGNATEDVVFINSPPTMEHLRINMVELFTTVSDKRGALIEDLERDDFSVFEEAQPQEITRFEMVSELPIHAGVVLDASTSMEEELDEAVKAALKFFEGVLRPKDRAAVVVFNDQPVLKVPFTNKPEVLAGGLSEIKSEGDTALYDSLVYMLYYLAGIKGKRALILISDGEDSRSRHSFDEAMDFAIRSGVAIYTIGLGTSRRAVDLRSILQRLARQTAGRSFFIDSARELDSIYSLIEEELRSQYLLAYQSTHEEGGDFRRVEVRVGRAGLKAKTIPGYYP